MADTYTTKQAAEITGVKYSTIDAWSRKGIFTPTTAKSQGRGTWRLYSRRDLVVLRVLGLLNRLGFSYEDTREISTNLSDYMKKLSQGSTLHVWLEKEGFGITRQLKKVQGKEAYLVVEIKAVIEAVNQSILDLYGQREEEPEESPPLSKADLLRMIETGQISRELLHELKLEESQIPEDEEDLFSDLKPEDVGLTETEPKETDQLVTMSPIMSPGELERLKKGG
jgi:DNA-binding transcriptional MerR regulator